ncbi:hypothetical protein [Psittacicella hinzii]|uniref:Uncharacterized protein n=1 Tax=Psittacicella hinzii TaxID=2028575 RepID=A0A3A1YL40_9GAMM|nr:hypothetical protein [Psittacicella hinzii]RIY37949.1 hypothetical protein CKF58_04375 [Psittacicella hinzii]
MFLAPAAYFIDAATGYMYTMPSQVFIRLNEKGVGQAQQIVDGEFKEQTVYTGNLDELPEQVRQQMQLVSTAKVNTQSIIVTQQ